MNILITGAAGFIGYHLVQKLSILSKNHNLTCIDGMVNSHPIYEYRYNELLKSQKSQKIKLLKLNLLQTNELNSLFEENKFDMVIHLAAKAGVRESIKDPQVYIDNNVSAFTNLLQVMKDNNVKRLIYASSSSVYGENNVAPFDEVESNVDFPESLYAATKRMNEMEAYTYSKLYGIKSIGLRFFTVYGEYGRPDMAPFIFSHKIFNKEKITVFNNGEQTRDFTYVGDIVDGIDAIVNKFDDSFKLSNTMSKVYNIGSNKPIHLMEFISTLEKIIGHTTEKEFIEKQKGDVSHTHASVKLLQNDFNYSPSTSLEEGLSKFINWYKKFL